MASELQQAKQLYRQGRLAQAATLAGFCLRKNPADADAMQLLGTIQYRGGQTAGGRALVESSLELDPLNADAWNSLGLMRHLAGDDDGAAVAFDRATQASPDHGEAWMNRGFIAQEQDRHEAAAEYLTRALSVGFDAPQVHFFLGNALASLYRQEAALAEFDFAIAGDERYADAWNNRGTSLLALGRMEEAAESMQNAIRLAPQDPLAYLNLALTLHRLGDSDQALTMLDTILGERPDAVEPRRVKADILIDLDRLDEAAAALERSIELKPDDRRLKAGLARVAQHQGSWRQSLGILADARDVPSKLLRSVTLPIVLDSKDTIAEARTHLRLGIEEVRAAGGALKDPLAEVGQTTFYLAYHGIGERDLQQLVAETYREVYPGLKFEAGHTPSKGGRIRVGFLSAFLHSHTIGKLFASLIERLDRDRFEVLYLQLGRTDEVTQRLAQSADRHVVLPRTIYESMHAVAREELDVLFYTDIGMDAHSYYLAFARLAPVQCVTWGHPMTTGSPTMDYFVSSEHLEREDGEAEYSESLVRLPSLTTFFRRPAPPAPVTRVDFGLDEDARLYACPQTLFKFHPDFDDVLASILEQDEKGRLLMIAPKTANWQQLLVERWQRTHPVIAERAIFLPGMKLDRFLGLAALSDAVLDPIQFGGGNSSMEFFASGAPVVTLPQSLLRNRITYAAYKQIGFEDLIARDEEHYVELALRLANDSGWQQNMRRQISARSAPLFENAAAVEELSGFLERVRPS